ncbi:MAG TPA: (2Fe-2S)-binding protein [Rhodocyclaceae bacterium]|jgi:bacterioferritin-associated ferredoxin|nr:(2Fe-2S)-binding protein [Rhodocyclaceae bacterium]HRQ48624.1 (2Fe-2S)-binding protein [Rhodocyclaceae bacterium]
MYVCICNAVTERHIETAVEGGATRMRDLRERLGVTADCGRCASCAHKCLKSALQAPAPRSWRNRAMDSLSGVFPLDLEIQQ